MGGEPGVLQRPPPTQRRPEWVCAALTSGDEAGGDGVGQDAAGRVLARSGLHQGDHACGGGRLSVELRLRLRRPARATARRPRRPRRAPPLAAV